MQNIKLFLVFHDTEAEGGDQTVPGKTHKLKGNVVLSEKLRTGCGTEELTREIYGLAMQMLAAKRSLKEIGGEIAARVNNYFCNEDIFAKEILLLHEMFTKNEDAKSDYYYEWNNERMHSERQ